jgi:hypothetical protein
MQYKLVRLNGKIVQLNINIEEPEVDNKIRSLKVGPVAVDCKYLGNLTFAEQGTFAQSKVSGPDAMTLIGFVSVIGFLVWGISAQINANTNIRPSAAVVMAAAPLSATRDISISNSEYSFLSACDARDAQLYRVRDKDGNQIAVICGGNAIQFPWQPQKGFTLRATN